MTSKVKAKCLEIIRKNPGILRSELHKMGIGYRTTINLYESRLVYDGTIVRVWDCVMRSYRLYPRGKVPCIVLPRFYKKNLHSYCGLYFAEKPNPDLGEAHGDKFYRAFDEEFGILYIDLKIISGACGMMDDAQTEACKIAPTEAPVSRGVIPRGASDSAMNHVVEWPHVELFIQCLRGLHSKKSLQNSPITQRLEHHTRFAVCMVDDSSTLSGDIPASLFTLRLLDHGAGQNSFQNITNHPVSCADYNSLYQHHATRGSFPEHDNTTPDGSGFQLFQTPPPNYIFSQSWRTCAYESATELTRQPCGSPAMGSSPTLNG